MTSVAFGLFSSYFWVNCFDNILSSSGIIFWETTLALSTFKHKATYRRLTHPLNNSRLKLVNPWCFMKEQNSYNYMKIPLQPSVHKKIIFWLRFLKRSNYFKGETNNYFCSISTKWEIISDVFSPSKVTTGKSLTSLDPYICNVW